MTRMWMGDPKTMCKNHLLGEHKEIHQLLGSLKKGFNVDGYVRNNCIEINSIERRHNELVVEMTARGWNHWSPIITQDEIKNLATHLKPEVVSYKIDVFSSDLDRFGRCSVCNKMKC